MSLGCALPSRALPPSLLSSSSASPRSSSPSFNRCWPGGLSTLPRAPSSSAPAPAPSLFFRPLLGSEGTRRAAGRLPPQGAKLGKLGELHALLLLSPPSRPRWGPALPPPSGSPLRERVPAAMRAAAARRPRVAGRGRGLLGEPGSPGAPSHARSLPALRLLRLLRPSPVLTQTHSSLLLLFPLLDPAPARRAEAPPTRQGEGGPGVMSPAPSRPARSAPPRRPPSALRDSQAATPCAHPLPSRLSPFLSLAPFFF